MKTTIGTVAALALVMQSSVMQSSVAFSQALPQVNDSY